MNISSNRVPLMHIALFLFLSLLFIVPAGAQQQAAPRESMLPVMSHALRAVPGTSDGARPRAISGEVRVLAVMVEFLKDDDTRTSGDGTFGSIYPVDYGAEILDPFPHDNAYFRAHLEFLKNYVRKASGDVATIHADIMDNIVTVPGKIQDYSTVRSETNQPIADFAVAAWTAADAAHPGFDFAGYDMFIIFHASRGQDVDLTSIQGSNPTPFDLPSLSFTPNAFKRFYGDGYQGIPVSGGTFHITNTSVLPTTNNREIRIITGDLALLELTINGLLAASFGTFAGLPDLFDTNTGRTGIGRFGLMDAESIFAYGGISPPAPSAWEKIQLGWAVPRLADAGTAEYFLTAQRSDQISISDIVKVPLSSGEYWLLENRHRDPAGNGQTITMNNSGTVSSKTFPKDTTSFQNGDVSALSGVIIDVEDLDWSLPGGTVIVNDKQMRGINGGMLIWHIDESIIGANLATNTVNANPAQRGVDLEQAGGAQDIGETLQSAFGSEVAAGSALDYWFRGNIAPLYANTFAAGTYPDTRSNNGSYSHIGMRDFSSHGPLMSVIVSIGDDVIAPLAGYPVNLGESLAVDSALYFVQTADLTGSGAHSVFVAASAKNGSASDTALVFGLAVDRSPLLANSAAYRVVAESGIVQWSGAPLISDITGDGVKEIIVYGRVEGSQRVSVYTTADAGSDGLYDFLYSFEFGIGHAAEVVPTIRDGKLYVSMPYTNGVDTLFVCGATVTRTAIQTTPGPGPIANSALAVFPGTPYLLHATESSATVLDADAASPVSAQQTLLPARGMNSQTNGLLNGIVSDFDGDNMNEGAALTSDGLRILSLANDTRSIGRDAVPATMNVHNNPLPLAAMDVDGDNRNDIVLADGDRVLVYNYALSSTDYFPATFGATYTLGVRFPGASRDVMFAIGDRRLSQIVTGAKQAEGFPVPLPADASVSMFPLGTGAQRLGIATIGSSGRLYVFETQNEVDANSFVWRSIYSDERNSNFATGKGSASAPIETFFPAERCYNWPNPTYEPITKFRFYVSVDASVTVKVYDLAGDRVDELTMQAVGGVDNELDWNVSNVQSGVYVAHVKAEGGGQSGEKIIKVAIVK